MAPGGSYLPFGTGDAWTFDDGSSIEDAGQTAIPGTTGPGQNPVYGEQLDFYGPSGTFVGNVQLIKGPWPPGLFATVPSQDPLTSVAAITDATGQVNYFGATQVVYYGANVQSFYDFPGMPIADDTPVSGEEFFLSSNAEEFVAQAIIAPGCCTAPAPVEPQPLPNASNTNDSVVVRLGDTQPYPYTAPTTTIANVATTLFDPSEGSAVDFGFAPGYGFVSIYNGNATVHLQSFTGPGSTAARIPAAHRLRHRPAPTLRRHDGAVTWRDVLARM